METVTIFWMLQLILLEIPTQRTPSYAGILYQSFYFAGATIWCVGGAWCPPRRYHSTSRNFLDIREIQWVIFIVCGLLAKSGFVKSILCFHFSGNSYKDILSAYSNELSLKTTIKEEIAHCSRKESLVAYITSWTLQPFITKSCGLLCESIFLETGVR